VQTYTEKIIWNGIIFDNKQSWFSEMNRQCVPIADEDMKIARYE
jgi:hypothetical protein